jgi:hypothetical protein
VCLTVKGCEWMVQVRGDMLYQVGHCLVRDQASLDWLL